MCKSYDRIIHLRGYDGIGRHARFRFWWETVQVQALLPAPRQNNTIRSLAAASGVRSTDGVVFPFQIEPAALGFDLVLGASFMCWHLYCYAITRRSKLCIACSDFFVKIRAHTRRTPLLFRKRSHSARLLGCKRPRDSSLSLPTFCGVSLQRRHLKCSRLPTLR